MILVATTRIAAAEDRARARSLFEEASRRYALGEYPAALERFKSAFDAFSDPVFLYNIAQCWRAMGERAQAATLYRSYLRALPFAPNADEVRRLIVALDADLLREQATRKRPPEGTLAPAPQPPSPPRPPWWKNEPAWAVTGAGVGVALLGVGLAGGSVAVEDQARTAATLLEQHDRQAQAQRLEIAGWTVLGVGAAAAVVGVALLAHRRR